MDENQNVTTEEQNLNEQSVPQQDVAADSQPVYQQNEQQQNTQYQQNVQYDQNAGQQGNPYQQNAQYGYNTQQQNAQYGQQGNPYQQNAQYGYNTQQQNAQYGYNTQQQNAQYGQNMYNQAYQNPPVYMNVNGAMPQPQKPVKDAFCNILLVLNPLLLLVGFMTMFGMVRTMTGSMMYGFYRTTSPYLVIYVSGIILMMLLGVAAIVFLILDIVRVHKSGAPITGLILFAIFLRQGYYIWRAHVLKRNMTFPIVYTVIYALLTIAYTVYSCGMLANFVSYATYMM